MNLDKNISYSIHKYFILQDIEGIYLATLRLFNIKEYKQWKKRIYGTQ